MKKLLGLILGISLLSNSYASHYIGGNFTVVQTGANTFSITLQAFRDCGGITLPASLTVSVYRQSNNTLVSSHTLTRTQQFLVSLGDACYTPSLCIQENVYVNSNVTLANEVGGYYVTYSECCRNGGITNITNPASASMTFYADIPNPALAGGNSTPVFGPYPADGYFCINNTVTRDFSAVDPDGDSLVYSLITPYARANTGPKPFPTINWQAPYNLANILGGTPPMSINPQTGIITANANVAGVFVFSVLVEEYRNGIKIGEVHRDVQYQALACQLDDPPSFVNLQPTNVSYVNYEVCFDILANDADGDTIYLDIFSNNFDYQTAYVPPVFGGGTYTYTNFQGGGNFSVTTYQNNNWTFMGVGDIPLRFCFTPECGDMDSIYVLDLTSYSLGCSGSDTVQTTVNLAVQPAVPSMQIPDTLYITYGDAGGLCFDFMVTDSINFMDTLFIEMLGNTPSYNQYLVAPSVGLVNGQLESYYTNFFGNDTLVLNNYTVSNDIYSAVINNGLRYCIEPDCAQSLEGQLELDFLIYSSACGVDTTEKQIVVIFNIPPDGLVPNLQDSVSVTYGDNICFDIIFTDSIHPSETIFLEMMGNTTDYNIYLVPPSSVVVNGQIQYFYTNFFGNDTVWFPNYSSANDIYSSMLNVGLRYCIEADCQLTLSGDLNLSYLVYTSYCVPDTLEREINVSFYLPPPNINLDIPTLLDVTYGDQICIDFIAFDNTTPDDILFVKPYGGGFNYSSNYVPPTSINIGGQTSHYYTDFMGLDTIWLDNYTVSGGAYGAIEEVPLRYCMVADCEGLYLGEYNLNYMAFSTYCGSDTVYGSSKIIIDPVNGYLEEIPNVFSPNGDGVNDYFTLRGLDDPCYDEMDVKIYNRWGKLVFQSDEPRFKWDGNNKNGGECAEGTYFVLIEGTYGSIYDIQGNKNPIPVKKQYTIQLVR